MLSDEFRMVKRAPRGGAFFRFGFMSHARETQRRLTRSHEDTKDHEESKA
jgi:hypothetical protein